MKNYRIAERYARGLSATLDDNAAVNEIARALRTFAALYSGNHELRNILCNASIRVDVRMRILDGVLDQAQAPAPVANLCRTLLRRHRMDYLPDVARAFRRIADERLNQMRARIVSAVELDEQQVRRVTAALEKFTSKKIKIDTDVNPEILGGIVAYLGSIVIDGSVKSRLERMRALLAAQE